MKYIAKKGLSLIFLLLVSTLTYAETITGKVIGVSDGDTITVLDHRMNQHKIRLAGIDAPEKEQAFGQISKKSLSNMVFSKIIDVEYHEEDRYHRKIGKALLGGTDINLEQVKLGYAWHYKRYQKTQDKKDREAYSIAEARAASSKIGLWADTNPVAPWDFRKKSRNSQ